MKLSEVVEMLEKARAMLIDTSSGKLNSENGHWRIICEKLTTIIERRL